VKLQLIIGNDGGNLLLAPVLTTVMAAQRLRELGKLLEMQ